MAPGTMQATKFAAVLLLCAIASRSSAVVVSSCEEFAAVDRKTATEVTITNADFTCTEYTRLSIKSPSMALKSSVGAVTFSNLALSVYGVLTVEPDVEFTGIELVVCRKRTFRYDDHASHTSNDGIYLCRRSCACVHIQNSLTVLFASGTAAAPPVALALRCKL